MSPCRACVRAAAEDAGSAGGPLRSVLVGVSRWAELRVRDRPGDRYELLAAEVEQRNAADLLRAAGWTE